MLAALSLLGSVEALKRRVLNRPLEYFDWLHSQDVYHRCGDKRVLYRTGNQSLGKTTAGLAGCVWRATGTHPHLTTATPPVEIWVITASWLQSVVIQEKLWNLAPKDQVDPATIFDPIRGFKGKNPALKFKNGSIIRIKTTQQGGLNLASATIHHALFDEPPISSRIYGEVCKRVQYTNGTVHLTMTPINADCTWIEEEVKDGKLTDLHFRLEPENLIFVGSGKTMRLEDGSPCDEAWIERIERGSLSWEVPVVVHGEWEMRAVDRLFENFHAELVIPDLMSSSVAPTGRLELYVGLDYGADRLRTVGLLVGIDRSDKENTKVYILREYAPTSSSTTKMDAIGLLTMVASAGIKWHEIDEAWGDKRYTDAKGRITRKSNAMMTTAIEKELALKRGIKPAFKGAKKGIGGGAGAVMLGVRWINNRQITPGSFFIDASCVWTIESLAKWDGTSRSKYKDAIDALRYGLRSLIYPRTRHMPRSHRQVF